MYVSNGLSQEQINASSILDRIRICVLMEIPGEYGLQNHLSWVWIYNYILMNCVECNYISIVIHTYSTNYFVVYKTCGYVIASFKMLWMELFIHVPSLVIYRPWSLQWKPQRAVCRQSHILELKYVGLFNTKVLSYQYWDSHFKDKMVS